MLSNLSTSIDDLCKINPKISVVLKREKLPKLKKLIIKNYKSITKFSMIIRYCRSSLGTFLRGKNNPTFLTFKKIAEKLDLRPEEFILKIVIKDNPRGTFIPIEAFPIKGSEALASLIGHTFGDGHIGKSSFTFTNKSQELIESVMQKVKQLPAKKITINERFHKARTIGFPRLVRDIFVAAGAPVGNKIVQSFEIPKWIKNGSLGIKRSFLQALFDDESTVSPKSREIVLNMKKIERLTNNLHYFFDELKSLLKEIGVEGVSITTCHRYEGKNGITLEKRLRICGTSSFVAFQSKIGFLNNKKTEKLKILIEGTQRFQLRSGEAKEKIMYILQKDREFTTKGIAKKIGISNWSAWNYLQELEKKNLVERIRTPNSSHFWHLKRS